MTLGAGGGSIAKLDRSGLLTVGPDSAGAVPGPACYGQGGTSATATDAYVVLGYLDPENFLGGRRRLDPDAATEVVATLAAELGMDRLRRRPASCGWSTAVWRMGFALPLCGVASIRVALLCWHLAARLGCTLLRWRRNWVSAGWRCRSPPRCCRPGGC